MLVPGISSVFDVFYCKNESDRCYYDDNTSYTGPITHLNWKTWLISICLALAVMVLHLFGRLIPLKDEYPVS